MTVYNIIRIICFTIFGILIFINYIEIKGVYKYLIILFIIIPAILMQTSLAKNISKNLEEIFIPMYTLVSVLLILIYSYSVKKK
ncbi:hypothetical protein [Clostridium tarantellae]|uniref:Uncharacterized protein n=1 Tax=Clostridium tarantellae TaxID=39493 RepID=A0A6I1MXI7_9CLOT|nr:hypothetical protein [Clostridium tarantellae]MPQ44869.1 hypothetical protein [Clostridium tarantellae]